MVEVTEVCKKCTEHEKRISHLEATVELLRSNLLAVLELPFSPRADNYKLTQAFLAVKKSREK